MTIIKNTLLRLCAVELKLLSLELFALNTILTLASKNRRLRRTRLAAALDGLLAKKRDTLNKKTARFIKERFLALA